MATPSIDFLNRMAASSLSASSSTATSLSSTTPIALIPTVGLSSYESHTPFIPNHAEFELTKLESIARLDLLKNTEITLIPDPKALEFNRLPFPMLRFDLTELSQYLSEELTMILGHPARVWLVGRAARHVISGVNFNDLDLCIYSENPYLNQECFLFKKQHFIFNNIRNGVVDFLVRKLNKTKEYATFSDKLTSHYLIRACYLTNSKIFDDGSGCLYSFGGKIDIKIIFGLDKIKSVSDVDGFHICLSSSKPILKCANGKLWCATKEVLDQAIYRAEHRLFYIYDDKNIRDLIFRLILESTQGFQIQSENIETGFNQLLHNYPTQESFTAVFCRHQINHCKDQRGRIIDFLSWITYAGNNSTHIQRIASAWLDGSRKLELSDSIEIPIAIFLKKNPEKTSFFLSFLKGLLLLQFAKTNDGSIRAYEFPFMENPEKPKAQFGFFKDRRDYHLFTGQTPIQIASDFLAYHQALESFVGGVEGMKQFRGLFSFLGIDDSLIDGDRTPSKVALNFLGAFTKKSIADVLRIQYRNCLPLQPFYDLLRKQIKGEDLSVLKNEIALLNLQACLNQIPEDYQNWRMAAEFILKQEKDLLYWSVIPELLSKVLWDESLKNNAYFSLFKDSIATLLPNLINEVLATTGVNQTKDAYAFYDILHKTQLLSLINKNKLLINLVKACQRHNELLKDQNWVEKLCCDGLEAQAFHSGSLNLESIQACLYALNYVSISQNSEVLLKASYYLESLSLFADSYRDDLGQIILQLTRNASIKKSFALSRQVAVLFCHINKRYPTLLTSILNRGGDVLIGYLVRLLKDLEPYLSSDLSCMKITYRLLDLIAEKSSVVSPSVLALFYAFLRDSNLFMQSLSNIRILGRVSLKLLKRKDIINKSEQLKLAELALHLLSKFEKNTISVRNSRMMGLELITLIFKKWPEHDECFDSISRQLWTRTAHCILKKKCNENRVKQQFPTYIEALTILFKDHLVISPVLQSLHSIDFIAYKRNVAVLILEIQKSSLLLTDKVFLQLEKASGSIKKDLEKPEEKRATPSEPAIVGKKVELNILLEKQIRNCINSNRFIGQDEERQQAFNILSNSLLKAGRVKEVVRELEENSELKISFNELLEDLLRSTHPNSPLYVYKLFEQAKLCRIVAHERASIVYLQLIKKFTENAKIEHLIYLELLLEHAFKFNHYSLIGLDDASYRCIINAYQLVLEKSQNINLNKSYEQFSALLKNLTRTNAPKLAYLGFILIKHCLVEKREDNFAIAIKTFKILINANLLNYTLSSEIEILCILLVHDMPKSWKTGLYDTQLRELLHMIKSKTILSNLSAEASIQLFKLMLNSGNSLLTNWAKEMMSIFSKKSGRIDQVYCLDLFRKIKDSYKAEDVIILYDSLKLLEENVDLMRSIFTTPKHRIALNNVIIRLFLKTQNLHYHSRVCDLFMQELVSASVFPLLMQSFIDHTVVNYTNSFMRQSLEVMQHYVKHYMSSDKIASLSIIKRLSFKFLKRLVGIEKIGEAIQFLSLLLKNFSFIDVLESDGLNKVISLINKQLFQRKRMQDIGMLVSLIIEHLDDPLKKECLKIVEKGWNLKNFSVKAKHQKMTTIETVGLTVSMSIYVRFNPTEVQRYIFGFFEILKRNPTLSSILSMANLMISAYENDLFEKYTIAPWKTSVLTGKVEALRTQIKEIDAFLIHHLRQRHNEPNVADTMIRYLMAILRSIKSEDEAEIDHFFALDESVTPLFMYNFLIRGNPEPLLKQLNARNNEIQHKPWRSEFIRSYFLRNVESPIYQMLIYSLIVQDINVILKTKRGYSPSDIVKMISNRENINRWIIELTKEPLDSCFKTSDEGLAILIKISLDQLINLSKEQFEFTIKETMIHKMVLLAYNLLKEYVAGSFKCEKTHVDIDLSTFLYHRKLNLFKLITSRTEGYPKDVNEAQDFLNIQKMKEIILINYQEIQSISNEYLEIQRIRALKFKESNLSSQPHNLSSSSSSTLCLLESKVDLKTR